MSFKKPKIKLINHFSEPIYLASGIGPYFSITASTHQYYQEGRLDIRVQADGGCANIPTSALGKYYDLYFVFTFNHPVDVSQWGVTLEDKCLKPILIRKTQQQSLLLSKMPMSLMHQKT